MSFLPLVDSKLYSGRIGVDGPSVSTEHERRSRDSTRRRTAAAIASTFLSSLAILTLGLGVLAGTGDAAQAATNMLGAGKVMTATATVLLFIALYRRTTSWGWVVAALALNVLPLAFVVSTTIWLTGHS